MPRTAWRFATWRFGNSPGRASRAREAMLSAAVRDLGTGPGTGRARYEVVDAAITINAIQPAVDALVGGQYEGNESDNWLFMAVELVFKRIEWWDRLVDRDVRLIERKLLAAAPRPAGYLRHGHRCEHRSETLGQVGVYRFFSGRRARALTLWRAATDPRDVDEYILSAIDLIIQNEPHRIAAGRWLAEQLRLADTRSRGLALLAAR